MSLGTARVGVLVLAGGADWEREALAELTAAGFVVLKRCVDVADLMATASVGSAAVAVVSDEVPGLDSEAVMHLLRYDVRTLAVCMDQDKGERLGRIGVARVSGPESQAIAVAVSQVLSADVVVDPDPVGRHLDPDAAAEVSGRLIAVWGPTGAPGRTTVAISLAAEHAAQGRSVVLIDADPYGGAVAQQFGILDEVSGVLAAARLSNTGALEPSSFATCCRSVGASLNVLTGLPRADRRVEVRASAMDQILQHAAALGDVVVDCGFCIEDDQDSTGLGRDRMTLDVLLAADEIVVVGSAEPVGLSRLARGLVELAELVGALPVRVVVNRMRSSLGWSEPDIVTMIESYLQPLSLHFVPEDQATLDRAQVRGKSLVELGDSSVRKAIAGVHHAAFGAVDQAPKSR